MTIEEEKAKENICVAGKGNEEEGEKYRRLWKQTERQETTKGGDRRENVWSCWKERGDIRESVLMLGIKRRKKIEENAL